MPSEFGFALLIPAGLMMDSGARGDDALVVTALNRASTAACPLYGTVSQHVRSRWCSNKEIVLRASIAANWCAKPSEVAWENVFRIR